MNNANDTPIFVLDTAEPVVLYQAGYVAGLARSLWAWVQAKAPHHPVEAPAALLELQQRIAANLEQLSIEVRAEGPSPVDGLKPADAFMVGVHDALVAQVRRVMAVLRAHTGDEDAAGVWRRCCQDVVDPVTQDISERLTGLESTLPPPKWWFPPLAEASRAELARQCVLVRSAEAQPARYALRQHPVPAPQ